VRLRGSYGGALDDEWAVGDAAASNPPQTAEDLLARSRSFGPPCLALLWVNAWRGCKAVYWQVYWSFTVLTPNFFRLIFVNLML
jgi:hypothetical protein